jgi:very-short-patch-repair endonuclease
MTSPPPAEMPSKWTAATRRNRAVPMMSPLPLGEGQGEGVAPPNYRDDYRAVTMRPVVKRLRRTSTDAKRALWQKLRGGQVGGAKFRRQHQFGPYVLDFYCPKQRLAVEADGGQHYDPAAIASDQARTAYLDSRGVRVLRFSNSEVLVRMEAVLEMIQRALVAPSPYPSPRGRGDAR